MKIALISSPYGRTPPRTYGSSGQVVSLLVEGLVSKGHDVTLYATGDSQTKGTLKAYFKEPVGDFAWVTWPHEMRHVQEALKEAASFDIIHNHTQSGIVFSHLVDAPMVHTVHSVFYLEDEPDLAFFRSVPGRTLVNVSRSQQRLLAHPEPTWVVYNAVDETQFPYSSAKGNYLLHIGRLTAVKGTHLAVQAAKHAGEKLILAGPVFEEDKQFFVREIAPSIDGSQIQYIGPVGGAGKMALLQGAKALLVPICWEEPFGLVMIEAMSCGTPVVAFNRGSVPEIVEHGKTGFIVDDLDSMCMAVKNVAAINPACCHAAALERFSPQRMVSNYEEVYKSVIQMNK